MIYWEENSVEGNWFDTLYRRNGSYVFDFSRWIWVHQLGTVKQGASTSYYEHPEFWAGVVDVLSDAKRAHGQRLPDHTIVRWSCFSDPTSEQIEKCVRPNSTFNSRFVQIAVARVNLRQGEPKLLRKEWVGQPDWFDKPAQS